MVTRVRLSALAPARAANDHMLDTLVVAQHEQGFADGQAALIRIMDAAGLMVYEGEFTAASYVRETFSDRKIMRYGGAALAAAGALLSLVWPRSRNLALTPLPGGGRVAASLGF